MPTATADDRLHLVALDTEAHLAEFAEDVAQGLASEPRRLSCRYFYDELGSQLFEQICDLPEYYVTRTERVILQERAPEIAALFPGETAMVELGSGSSAKTRILIEAFLHRHSSLRYVSIDISPTILEQSSTALLQEYPRLEVVAVAAEYAEGLRWLKTETGRPKLILWLGSNVGNLGRAEATQFLLRIRGAMSPGDRLLAGIDLRKERAVLERAYDDSQGVTARFNLNILSRINRELDADFDPSAFRHQAVWNEELGRVEMYLVSLREQSVRIGRLARVIRFASGEAIHTENSYKYSPEEIAALAHSAALGIERQWVDAQGRFSVNLLAPERA